MSNLDAMSLGTDQLVNRLNEEVFSADAIARHHNNIDNIKNGEHHLLIAEALTRKDFDSESFVEVFIKLALMYGEISFITRAAKHPTAQRKAQLYCAWATLEWKSKKNIDRALKRIQEGRVQCAEPPSELDECEVELLREAASSGKRPSGTPRKQISKLPLSKPPLFSTRPPVSAPPPITTLDFDIFQVETPPASNPSLLVEKETTNSINMQPLIVSSGTANSAKRSSATNHFIPPLRSNTTTTTATTIIAATDAIGKLEVQASNVAAVKTSASTMTTIPLSISEQSPSSLTLISCTIPASRLLVICGRPFEILEDKIGTGGTSVVSSIRALGPAAPPHYAEDLNLLPFSSDQKLSQIKDDIGKVVGEAQLSKEAANKNLIPPAAWKVYTQQVVLQKGLTSDFYPGSLWTIPEGQVCALKSVNVSSELGGGEAFRKETELLKRLTGANHVIQLYGADLHEDHSEAGGATSIARLVLEMASVKLSSLVSLNLSIFCLRRLLSQLAESLLAIRMRGIIHSDFKPLNVLCSLETAHTPTAVSQRATVADIPIEKDHPEWGPGGCRLSIRLIDFGISKSFSEQNDSTSVLDLKPQGTAVFVAPEVCSAMLRNNPVVRNSKEDVYAFGLTVYMMLFKVHPYEDFKKQGSFAVFEAAARPSEIVIPPASEIKISDFDNGVTGYEHLPAYVKADLELARDLCEKCLKKQPADRLSVEALRSHPFLTDEIGRTIQVIFTDQPLRKRILTSLGLISNGGNSNNNSMTNKFETANSQQQSIHTSQGGGASNIFPSSSTGGVIGPMKDRIMRPGGMVRERSVSRGQVPTTSTAGGVASKIGRGASLVPQQAGK